MTLNHQDITFITKLMDQAAHEAIRVFSLPAHKQEQETKDDESPVSQADRRIESLFREHLKERFPHIRLLGEEQGGNYNLPSWAIDPIDGTSSFLAGLPLWAVSLGLMNAEGQPEYGFLAIPSLGTQILQNERQEIILSCANGDTPVAWLTPRPDNALYQREAQVAVPSGFHKRFAFVPEFSGKVRSLGSTAIHTAYVAINKLDAALLGRPNLWDVAASWSLLRARGMDLYAAENPSRPRDCAWEPIQFDYFRLANRQKRMLIAGSQDRAQRLAQFIIWE